MGNRPRHLRNDRKTFLKYLPSARGFLRVTSRTFLYLKRNGGAIMKENLSRIINILTDVTGEPKFHKRRHGNVLFPNRRRKNKKYHYK